MRRASPLRLITGARSGAEVRSKDEITDPKRFSTSLPSPFRVQRNSVSVAAALPLAALSSALATSSPPAISSETLEASELRTTIMEPTGACTLRLAFAPASSRRFRMTGGLPV